MHVAARAIATHALSIFGDHSDVMACRQTGFAMLASASVQEAHDLACVAHAATLGCRVPFLHFFDGFRTSHEIATIAALDDDDLRFMVDEALVREHRARALTPDHPVVRGTAQNPDTFFQAREAANPFYLATPEAVQQTMDRLAERTGRRYHLFDYVGHPEAERVVVMMGSGAETAEQAAQWLIAGGERVGVVRVHLYRPFSVQDFVRALPPTTRRIAVLDRTKEPGAVGDPLYLDVVAALAEARAAGISRFATEPAVVAGRYGLSSKEFDPAMARAVFDELARGTPRRHFTVGIVDDVTGTSLPVDASFDIEPDEVVRAVFYGLGSDGTVGANKNSIKIIGEETGQHAQAYFVYDSKKAGATTVSHLRFGPRPIHSPYLIKKAGFVACHQFEFLEKTDVLDRAAAGAVFLLNAPHGPEEIWDRLPREVQEAIVGKGLRFYVIDAASVARGAGMAGRINTQSESGVDRSGGRFVNRHERRGGIHDGAPAGNGAVFRGEQETARSGTARAGDDKTGRCIEHDPGWTAAVVRGWRWNADDERLRIAVTVVQCRIARVIVGDPSEAERIERDAPGVHEVGIGVIRGDRAVGNQIVLYVASFAVLRDQRRATQRKRERHGSGNAGSEDGT